MIPRIKELYDSKIKDNLSKKLSLKNKLMSPKLEKIVIYHYFTYEDQIV